MCVFLVFFFGVCFFGVCVFMVCVFFYMCVCLCVWCVFLVCVFFLCVFLYVCVFNLFVTLSPIREYLAHFGDTAIDGEGLSVGSSAEILANAWRI